MGLIKTIITHYKKVKDGEKIVNTTNQYTIYCEDKYVNLITFSANNLNVAKFLISHVTRCNIEKAIMIKYNYHYEFYGLDQYEKPIKLVAKRAY